MIKQVLLAILVSLIITPVVYAFTIDATPIELLELMDQNLSGITNPLDLTDYNNSSQVKINGMGLYNPISRDMKYPDETIATAFQNDGYSATFANGTTTYDSTTFLKGGFSLKTETDTSNNAINGRKTSISPAINATGKNWKVWVRVSDADSIDTLSLYVHSDNSFVNGHIFRFDDVFQRASSSNVWIPITLSYSDATVNGTPDLSSIIAIQVFAKSVNGTSIEVNWGGLSLVDQQNEGIVSIIFDDGWDSAFDTAAPYMSTSSIPGTVCLIPNKVGTTNYATLAELKQLKDQLGWEMCGHHETNFRTLTATEVESTILEVKNYCLKNGLGSCDDFAYPNGAYDEDTVLSLIKRYFRSARGVDEFMETLPPADPYRLKILNITDVDATSTIQQTIQDAYNNKDWLLIVFHGVEDIVTASTQVQTEKFKATIDKIVSTGIRTMTWQDALNSFNPNYIDISNGMAGIGTSAPATQLDIVGDIRVGVTATTSCSSSIDGAIMYQRTDKHFYGCDGTTWQKLDN